MDYIHYVPSLTKKYVSLGFPQYDWSKHDTAPWVPVKKPLEESRISLIASSGIFRDDQEPFEPDGYNYYDHRDAVKDINCVYPVDRLREFEEEGFIGELAPSLISLGMGRTYRRSLIRKQLIPKVSEILHEQGVDGVIVVSS